MSSVRKIKIFAGRPLCTTCVTICFRIWTNFKKASWLLTAKLTPVRLMLLTFARLKAPSMPASINSPKKMLNARRMH